MTVVYVRGEGKRGRGGKREREGESEREGGVCVLATLLTSRQFAGRMNWLKRGRNEGLHCGA